MLVLACLRRSKRLISYTWGAFGGGGKDGGGYGETDLAAGVSKLLLWFDRPGSPAGDTIGDLCDELGSVLALKSSCLYTFGILSSKTAS